MDQTYGLNQIMTRHNHLQYEGHLEDQDDKER